MTTSSESRLPLNKNKCSSLFSVEYPLPAARRAKENSPAIYRWAEAVPVKVPPGRQNFGRIDLAEATFLSSLRDFCAGGARTPAMNRWAIFGRPCGTGLEAPSKASLPPAPDDGVPFHRKQRGTTLLWNLRPAGVVS